MSCYHWITVATRGTSKERLYEKLGLESRQNCCSWSKLCYLYKIVVNKSPNYLLTVAPSSNTIYNIRNTNDVPLVNIKHNFFKNTFFPSAIIEWNKTDSTSRNSTRFNSFKKSIVKFIRPAPTSIFQCHNPKGIKCITRLRMNFSHLCDHKFKQSFQDTINSLCTCSLEAETTNSFHTPLPLLRKRTSHSPCQHSQYQKQYFGPKWY